MSRTKRLRNKTRVRSFIAGGVIGAVLVGGIVGAELNTTEQQTVHGVASDLRLQADRLDALTTTTIQETTTTTNSTTTTIVTEGIIPAGTTCTNLNSASKPNSHYEGNHLLVAQAIQALWAANFRTLADIRAFVGIGRAESSLCPLTWHYHPPSVCVDRGWLQVNSCVWNDHKVTPNTNISAVWSDVSVFDVIGGAKAAYAILHFGGQSYSTWDTWKNGTAVSLQPTAATVCAVVKATGC